MIISSRRTGPFQLLFILCLVHLTSASCILDKPEIISPSDCGLVYGNTARLIVRHPAYPDFSVFLDGSEYSVTWQKEAWRGRWSSDISLENKGVHEIRLFKYGKELCRAEFKNNVTVKECAENVIGQFVSDNSPDSLKWDWAPAVFLYGLLKYAPFSDNPERCIDYVNAYHESWYEKGLPEINWADECPPALSALMLNRDFGNGSAMTAVTRAAEYIMTAPRNSLGSINHLGTSSFSFFYPDSIWVDSLMMWALFSVEYGLFSNNEELEEFGLSQPAIFAERLRDDKTGLFHHAWNIESDSLCPEDNAIWLRGNAWVMVSILEMISSINESDIRYGELCSMFQGLAESSLSYRQTSGYWDTVMSKPGFAYEESSGSALIAYAYAKGSRLGLIDDSYFYIAIDTFSSITSRLKKSSSGYAVEDVSSGTIPSNRYGYKLVPRGSNIPYGAGAYILLASELVNAGYR